MPRNLKEFLKKKKGYCSEGRCSCLLLSAWRDYDINGCDCEDGFYPIPTSITLSKTETTLVSGETDTITATVLPEEAAKFYPVVWTSSDNTIATVSDGVISFVKGGYATITAKSNTISKTVSVFCDVPVTGIVVDKDTVELDVGETETITATVSPADARPLHPVVWASDDETVATVNNGIITYVGAGTCTITATAGTKTATIDVTCKAPIPNYLCFTANTAGSTIQMSYNRMDDPTSIEYSLDGTTWSDFLINTLEIIGTIITLANVGDKVYMRNKSETPVSLSYYSFDIEGSVAASGDCNYLLCKNSTTEVPENGFKGLFSGCTGLTSAPQLPATTLANSCYTQMFRGCTSLTTLPELPATALAESCYDSMFQGCTNIKLSETQTGEYQTPYRIPTTGMCTYGGDALFDMFASTGGTFTGTPIINTTYYTSNTVI